MKKLIRALLIGVSILSLTACMENQFDNSIQTAVVEEVGEIIIDFDLSTADKEDILEVLGQPDTYLWHETVYSPDQSPWTYLMRYGNDLDFWVHNGHIQEMRVKTNNVQFDKRFKIGQKQDEVLSYLKEPIRFEDAYASRKETDVFYTDPHGDGSDAGYYHDSDNNIRFWFLNKRLSLIYYATDHYPSLGNDFDDLGDITIDFDINTISKDGLIHELGQPHLYLWNNLVYTPDNLPKSYIMVYGDELHFMIVDGYIHEMRVLDNTIQYDDRFKIGQSKGQLFKHLKEPLETSKDYTNAWQRDVYYQTAVENNFHVAYYHDSENNIRFWLSDDQVHTIAYGTEKYYLYQDTSIIRGKDIYPSGYFDDFFSDKRSDHGFEDDPELQGYWQFLSCTDTDKKDTFALNTNDHTFIDLKVLPNGSLNKSYYHWTKGYFISKKNPYEDILTYEIMLTEGKKLLYLYDSIRDLVYIFERY